MKKNKKRVSARPSVSMAIPVVVRQTKHQRKVPDAPKSQVVIKQEDLARLQEWIDYFTKASPRIQVHTPKDESFTLFLDKDAESEVRERKMLEDDYELLGWPKPEEVAFIVSVNSSEPGAFLAKYNPDYIRFFCFGGYAFGPLYFEWDGDGEAYYFPKTYSLSGYTKSALSWEYNAKIIIDRVAELEKRVPKLVPRKKVKKKK